MKCKYYSLNGFLLLYTFEEVTDSAYKIWTDFGGRYL